MNKLRAAAPLLGLGLILAACSSGGGGAAAPATPAPTTAAAASPAAATTAPDDPGYSKGGGATGAASLALADNALGKILTDAKGMSLYVFTPDNGGAPTCYDKCAQNWPALTSTGAPTVAAGLTQSDFASATRTDGTTQVTFHGWPLYYFAGDKAAGDTKGQGLGGKWYVVDGTGAMLGVAAASPSAAAGGGGAAINLATTSLGKVLVDGKGMTLYMFTADSNGKSACTGGCVDNWPPLLSDAAPTLGDGLDAEDFTTITRDDGKAQVAFYGQPLYTFAADKAAGDTTGQGVGGKWYVLGADGKPMK